MTQELKKCAHCGITPEMPKKTGDSKMWPNWSLFHICKKIGDKPGIMQIDISGHTKEQCVEYWNTRCDDERIRQLENELSKIVRCGECSYKTTFYCIKHRQFMSDSDFCSYGQRKE